MTATGTPVRILTRGVSASDVCTVGCPAASLSVIDTTVSAVVVPADTLIGSTPKPRFTLSLGVHRLIVSCRDAEGLLGWPAADEGHALWDSRVVVAGRAALVGHATIGTTTVRWGSALNETTTSTLAPSVTEYADSSKLTSTSGSSSVTVTTTLSAVVTVPYPLTVCVTAAESFCASSSCAAVTVTVTGRCTPCHAVERQGLGVCGYIGVLTRVY